MEEIEIRSRRQLVNLFSSQALCKELGGGPLVLMANVDRWLKVNLGDADWVWGARAPSLCAQTLSLTQPTWPH